MLFIHKVTCDMQHTWSTIQKSLFGSSLKTMLCLIFTHLLQVMAIICVALRVTCHMSPVKPPLPLQLLGAVFPQACHPDTH